MRALGHICLYSSTFELPLWPLILEILVSSLHSWELLVQSCSIKVLLALAPQVSDYQYVEIIVISLVPAVWLLLRLAGQYTYVLKHSSFCRHHWFFMLLSLLCPQMTWKWRFYPQLPQARNHTTWCSTSGSWSILLCFPSYGQSLYWQDGVAFILHLALQHCPGCQGLVWFTPAFPQSISAVPF